MSEFNLIEIVKDILPHGSGINAEWSISIGKNGKVYASNSYHAMDEHGFYREWIDFTVTLTVLNDESDDVLKWPEHYASGDLSLERINFHGQLDERISHHFGLSDSLWQTLDYAIYKSRNGG